ncbi:MAG: RNA polymerase recycling motor HelD [Bacillota bacterium]|nr:AAA family ATPase [Bacillota bacterium]HOB91571.1 RNA polymerase recycling motor HelD [Bacillota bacterium]HPZ54725.1 RNA polymerase recycling motor HelD [Bacillota bacterium]HQD17890.1 RNA polymerase recycling motor HelD [Bacillota bacterium]
MFISESEWARERERLAYVVNEARYQLQEMRQSVARRKESVLELRRSMWEEGPRILRAEGDSVNAAQYLAVLGREENDYRIIKRLERALERLADSPYFARVDFKLDGEAEPIQVYIGLSTLIDHSDNTHLVYDWRAPISSVFYDFEPGPASYKIDEVTVTGELLLKRQYRIARGELQYMFDTNLRISDEILQEVLSKTVDGRMKSIVTTIQREQNRIIREDANRVLVVQGPAGSGKTSVALHRIAYLMYKYRSSMSSDSVIIFSPNRIFSDYISGVLPELGEQDVNQITFHECAERLLGGSMRLQDMNQQLEYLLTNSESSDSDFEIRTKAIQYKSSLQFVNLLKRYAKYLEEEGIVFSDVVVNSKTVVTGKELRELVTDRYVYLPLGKRLDKVYRRILFLLRPLEEQRYKEVYQQIKDDPSQLHVSEEELEHLVRLAVREEFDPVKAEARRSTRLETVELYMRLFEDPELIARLSEGDGIPERLDEICRYTLQSIERRTILYEDLAPIAFLKALVVGVDEASGIRHVVLDEVQDYSPFHFEVLRLLFPKAGVTALGDLNQSVHPYTSANYESMLDILGRQRSTFVQLTRAYRSTEQITAFTRAMLKDGGNIQSISREGDKPVLIRAESEQVLMSSLESKIRELKQAGMESIAVICRTASDAKRVHEQLSKSLRGLTLITRQATAFEGGAVVIPSYLSKGLEFDAVLIHNASDAVYSSARELRLLYTACTRALHHLFIYYTGELTPLMSGIDSALYTSEEAGEHQPLTAD